MVLKRRRKDALLDLWAHGLSQAVFVPMAHADLRALVSVLVDSLADALTDVPDLARARAVGAELVRAALVDDVVPAATAQALGEHLTGLAAECGVNNPGEVAAAIQGAVFVGYVAASRQRILDEQETVRQAEVAARHQAESALRASEARFRAVFANAGIGIGIADLTGQIVDVNQAFATMLGYTREEFLTLRVDDFVYAEDASGIWQLYSEIIDGRRDHARVEKRYHHRDGRVVWTDLTASLIRDPAGKPLYTVAMVEDVTQRRELQQRLRHQALHDPLTRLPNRTLFQDELAAAFRRDSGRVGVCYLDVDRFKSVNDRLGHDVGDALLRQIARRLDDVVSARGHLLARMGGDEFVVLAVDPVENELTGMADVIVEALAKPAEVGGHTVQASVSLGVVEQDVTETTPADILKAADVTLYWAKSDGRNRWATFDPERHERDITRYTVAATLIPGLDHEQFHVEYQPLVDLADGRIHGVEALVRWAHPTMGPLQPDQFIEVAEEAGAIVPLGRWVMREACERAASWNTANPDSPLLISVNLAVRQAHEVDLLDDVTSIVHKTGLSPELLQLELTESALLGSAGRPVEAIAGLAEAGVRIAIDDFGTGYSNLSYLSRLPLHSLKLAGVLVGRLRLAEQDPIVTSLISLAHALGLTVTAEAVETAEQADRLRRGGCDTAQGWYYAPPMPWEELVVLLESGPLPADQPH
ncbi:MAG: putative bifunctional diguanylate cyclase/phosphodiesterase [Actinomycetota bacterium]